MQKYGERQVKCSGEQEDDNDETDTNVSKMNSFYSLSAKYSRY